MKTIRLIGACVVAATLLAACGGDDDNIDVPVAVTPADATQVPASAGSSSQTYTQYVQAQVATVSETTDPLKTDLILIPPTSETDDPVTL